MTVGALLWRLAKLTLRGQWRTPVLVVPVPADPRLRAALADYLGVRDWRPRSVDVEPGPIALVTAYAERPTR
ncbi:hypothetical protein [Dactylosporangium salmoneum]|uniref:Uncharacterized protein n=1 Tax=Dactylosporangium salmoneum TaxID=53361 RepID=A0ABP5SDF1_9ACTN